MIRATIAMALLVAACSHSGEPKQNRSAADMRSRFECVNETRTYHHDTGDGGLDTQGIVSVDNRGNPIASSIGCVPPSDPSDQGK